MALSRSRASSGAYRVISPRGASGGEGGGHDAPGQHDEHVPLLRLEGLHGLLEVGQGGVAERGDAPLVVEQLEELPAVRIDRVAPQLTQELPDVVEVVYVVVVDRRHDRPS